MLLWKINEDLEVFSKQISHGRSRVLPTEDLKTLSQEVWTPSHKKSGRLLTKDKSSQNCLDIFSQKICRYSHKKNLEIFSKRSGGVLKNIWRSSQKDLEIFSKKSGDFLIKILRSFYERSEDLLIEDM